MLLLTGLGRSVILLVAVALLAACEATTREGAEQAAAGTRYEDLVALFEEWREFQRPHVTAWVPDYTAEAMEAQRRELETYQRRLAAIDSSGRPISQQVDYHLVRAEMNGLEFAHRVTRPWSRNPAFYNVLFPSGTDVPAREGSTMYGAIELWTYRFPLSDERLTELRERLRAIPAILEQARGNLVEDARDLWFLGARVKRNESRALADLATRAAEHHPDLIPDVERAREAVDDFAAWLEERYPGMTAPSGVGVEDYDWYLKNVQLVPYTWEEQVALVQRELHRAWATLKLLENQNRDLPELEPVATEAEYQRRYQGAVGDFVEFLRREEILTVADYAEPALLAQEGGFVPPTRPRGFFTKVNYRDLRVMRLHGTHWFDLARMEVRPHPSPIRRVPLLYNIWAYRAEGFATAFEEMMMASGFLHDDPRAEELVYVLLAQRAARAMAGLKMHSNEFTLEEAVRFAVEWTPRGWLSEEGNTVWTEQQLYLEQPTYGASYVVGKIQIDRLHADRAHQLAGKDSLRRFMDEFLAAGMIPISLIRWEMTGLDDEVGHLW